MIFFIVHSTRRRRYDERYFVCHKFDTSMNKSALAQDGTHVAKYSSLDIGVLSITDLIEDLLNVFVKMDSASPQITILEKAALQIEGIFVN